MEQQTSNTQVAYCRICGKSLAPEEQHAALGTIYCAEHVPAPPPPPQQPGMGPQPDSPWTAPASAVPPPPGTTSASPGLAFILGLIPGVGAIYNGQYAKGLVHVVIFGLLISLANSDSVGDLTPLFTMLVPTWVIYQAFEAYHTARKREMGQPIDEFSSVFPGRTTGAPVGPVVLIGVGILFLFNNLGLLRFSQVLKFWPLLLIGMGVYMLYQRTAAARAEGVGRE